MTRHDLKVHPQFWPALIAGDKRFELRRNDRKFAVGHYLDLREYDPSYGYTGRATLVQVTYVLLPADCPGLEPGFCVLGMSNELS